MRQLIIPALAVLLLLLFLVDLMIGPVHVPVQEVISILSGEGSTLSNWRRIVLNVRSPQAATAALAGLGLATSGLLMQTLFRNPLAGPSVLGISSGASLAVAAVVLVGPGLLVGPFGLGAMVVAAFLGAVAVLLLILLADARLGDAGILLIIGLMIGYLCSALVSVLELHSSQLHLRRFVLWGMGSFSGVGPNALGWLAGVVVIGAVASLLLVKPLNALLLGNELAESMGVQVKQVRTWILLVTGLLAGSITAFCGPIAFLGLAVPHIARALVRTMDHRLLMPTTMLCGATVALLCDVITKLPDQGAALPLNAVTSMMGAPVVIWVLLKGRSWYSST